MILIHIITISLSVIGAYVAMKDGMILQFIPRILRNAPWWVKKPVFDCPVCMASVWGITFSLFLPILTIQLLLMVPAIAGLNWLIMLFVQDKITREWL